MSTHGAATQAAASIKPATGKLGIMIPGMGHIPVSDDEIQCLTTMELAFLMHPNPDAVDTSCADKMPFAPFD